MARFSIPTAGIGVGSVLAILLGVMPGGWAQGTQQGTQQPTQQATEQGTQTEGTPSQQSPDPAAAPQGTPDLFGEVGKFLSKLPTLKLPPPPQGTGEGLPQLGKPGVMVSGRVSCPRSPNGGPDCKLAANQLCNSKGYKEGKSLNADSTQKCSPKVLIPGRQRKSDDCYTDTVVTQALCQ